MLLEIIFSCMSNLSFLYCSKSAKKKCQSPGLARTWSKFDRNNLSVFCGCVFLFFIFHQLFLFFLVTEDGRIECSNLTKMVISNYFYIKLKFDQNDKVFFVFQCDLGRQESVLKFNMQIILEMTETVILYFLITGQIVLHCDQGWLGGMLKRKSNGRCHSFSPSF